MDLELKIYGALCSTEKFSINKIDADDGDFGSKSDIDSANAEEYGCGNMQFQPSPSSPEILDKYNISEEEYREVQVRLDGLSFGNCGWCI